MKQVVASQDEILDESYSEESNVYDENCVNDLETSQAETNDVLKLLLPFEFGWAWGLVMHVFFEQFLIFFLTVEQCMIKSEWSFMIKVKICCKLSNFLNKRKKESVQHVENF